MTRGCYTTHRTRTKEGVGGQTGVGPGSPFFGRSWDSYGSRNSCEGGPYSRTKTGFNDVSWRPSGVDQVS